MKTGLLLSLVISLISATLTFGETNPSNIMNVRTSDGGFSWVKKGKVSMIVFDVGKATTVLHIYINSQGDEMQVTGLLSTAGYVVQQELDESRVDAFVRNELPQYLAAVLTQDSLRIVDRSYLESYEDSIDSPSVRPAFRGDKDSLAKLKSLEVASACELAGGQWKLEFTVMTSRGGAERWIVSGQNTPFSIRELVRRSLLADGSIKPLVEFGGGEKGRAKEIAPPPSKPSQ